MIKNCINSDMGNDQKLWKGSEQLGIVMKVNIYLVEETLRHIDTRR